MSDENSQFEGDSQDQEYQNSDEQYHQYVQEEQEDFQHQSLHQQQQNDGDFQSILSGNGGPVSFNFQNQNNLQITQNNNYVVQRMETQGQGEQILLNQNNQQQNQNQNQIQNQNQMIEEIEDVGQQYNQANLNYQTENNENRENQNGGQNQNQNFNQVQSNLQNFQQPQQIQQYNMTLAQGQMRELRRDDLQISQILNNQQGSINNIQQNQNNIQNDQILNQNNSNNNNNTVFRSPLPDSLNSKYYNYKMKKCLNNSDFNLDDPYMKITILRNTNNLISEQQPQEYIINANGMKETKKNTDNNDIIIGRQASTTNDQNQEIHPNDIVLASNDRAISRIHCKIIYKEGFLKSQIQPDFMAFLGCTHQKSVSIWKKLPNYLMKQVLEFVKPEKKFYLVDIGSVYGTFIRVKPEEPQMVMKGQIYLIGADTQFNVTDVCVPGNDSQQLQLLQQKVSGSFNQSYLERKNGMDIECCSVEQRNETRGKEEDEEEEEGKLFDNDNNNQYFIQGQDQIFQNAGSNISIQEQLDNYHEVEEEEGEEEGKNQEDCQDKLFFEFLAEEKNKNKAQVHGLTESEEAILQKFIQKNSSEQNLNKTQQLGENSQRPFVKIELVSQGVPNQNNIQQNIHIFVAPIQDEKSQVQKKNFKIGRSQDCNIIITHNTISRKQSCIFYDYIRKQWFLHDGEIIGDIRRGEKITQIIKSSNGTWISLQDCREKRPPQSNRQESDQREIFNGTEIKISESILKVELFNMDKKKQQECEYEM